MNYAKSALCVAFGFACGLFALAIAPQEVVWPYNAIVFVIAVFVGWAASMAIVR